MRVLYQYNFTDGRIEFFGSNKVTDNMRLYCDNPKWEGYPVCAWKLKFGWYQSGNDGWTYLDKRSINLKGKIKNA